MLSDHFATICDELSIRKAAHRRQWLHNRSKRENTGIEQELLPQVSHCTPGVLSSWPYSERKQRPLGRNSLSFLPSSHQRVLIVSLFFLLFRLRERYVPLSFSNTSTRILLLSLTALLEIPYSTAFQIWTGLRISWKPVKWWSLILTLSVSQLLQQGSKAWEFAFLARSQMTLMLLSGESHFESHCSIDSLWDWLWPLHVQLVQGQIYCFVFLLILTPIMSSSSSSHIC